jgi:hypothetical protein
MMAVAAEQPPLLVDCGGGRGPAGRGARRGRERTGHRGAPAPIRDQSVVAGVASGAAAPDDAFLAGGGLDLAPLVGAVDGRCTAQHYALLRRLHRDDALDRLVLADLPTPSQANPAGGHLDWNARDARWQQRCSTGAPRTGRCCTAGETCTPDWPPCRRHPPTGSPSTAPTFESSLAPAMRPGSVPVADPPASTNEPSPMSWGARRGLPGMTMTTRALTVLIPVGKPDALLRSCTEVLECTSP